MNHMERPTEEPKAGELLTIAQAVKAFSNGYQLQYKTINSEEWYDLPTISEVDDDDAVISFDGNEKYRIKPAEPKLRPYTYEEFNDLILLSGKVPFVIEKAVGAGRKCSIREYENDRIWLNSRDYGMTLADAAEKLTWANGDPFGVIGE